MLLPSWVHEFLYNFALLLSVKDAIKCKDKSPSNMMTRKVSLSILQIPNIRFTKVPFTNLRNYICSSLALDSITYLRGCAPKSWTLLYFFYWQMIQSIRLFFLLFLTHWISPDLYHSYIIMYRVCILNMIYILAAKLTDFDMCFFHWAVSLPIGPNRWLTRAEF